MLLCILHSVFSSTENCLLYFGNTGSFNSRTNISLLLEYNVTLLICYIINVLHYILNCRRSRDSWKTRHRFNVK